MRFPWFREKRAQSSTGYTDLLLQSLVANAKGTTEGNGAAVAAAEVAAGLWGRCFAGAAVQPAGHVSGALSPGILEMLAREIIRRGDCLFMIDVHEGALALLPVAHWDVYGGYRPSTWRYQATLAAPDDSYTVELTSEQVVHVRYGASPSQPWRGISPFAACPSTSHLAGMIETRLGEEVGAAVATLIPIPEGTTTTQTEVLRDSLANLRGKLALVPSAGGGWGAGDRAAPRTGWRTERLGADPPDSLAKLRTDTAVHILAAAGVPVELFSGGEGTSSREAFRRFLHASVAPVARLIEAELSAKLETAVSFNFDQLFAADIQGRARAFQSLVGGGMDVSEALAVTGLLAAD